LWVHYIPVECEWCKWIYERSYIWTAEKDIIYRIFVILSWGGYWYFLELHNIRAYIRITWPLESIRVQTICTLMCKGSGPVIQSMHGYSKFIRCSQTTKVSDNYEFKICCLSLLNLILILLTAFSRCRRKSDKRDWPKWRPIPG